MRMRALAVLLLAPCCAALATVTVGAIHPGTTGRRLSPVARLSEEAPVADAVTTSGPILSCRCVSLLGPMLLLLAPRVARADEDSLVAALRDVRTDFSSEATGVAVLVQTREWDEVRTQIRRALTLLTLKGYLGLCNRLCNRQTGRLPRCRACIYSSDSAALVRLPRRPQDFFPLPSHVGVGDRHAQVAGSCGSRAAAIDSAPRSHLDEGFGPASLYAANAVVVHVL
eukprot:scaffold82362_cov65-Phaeocystis_antarctica.AAC.3